MADDSPTGTRPVQFIFSSGDAQPLTIQPGDRRFWVVEDAKTLTLDVPAQGASQDDIQRAFNDWLISRPLAAAADATLARAEQRAAEHPSRTPLCTDCRHMKLQGDSHMQFHVCALSPRPRCPVTGTVSYVSCMSARNKHHPCGPDGLLFDLSNPPVALSDETMPVQLTAAELAQARWSPGAGPVPSNQSPASPAPARAVD